MSYESRDSIDATLASDLSKRLTRLSEDRDIPLERLLDKSVELLLVYMENHDSIDEHVKRSNVEAINKNKEIIMKNRKLLREE